MNRLRFRKKLAVFISLVLVMQLVVGNVAFAEGKSVAEEKYRIEFNKDKISSFSNGEIIFSYSNGETTGNYNIKVKCKDDTTTNYTIAASGYNESDTNAGVTVENNEITYIGDFTKVNDKSNYHFEVNDVQANNTVTFIITIPETIKEVFKGIKVGDRKYDKGTGRRRTIEEKTSIT